MAKVSQKSTTVGDVMASDTSLPAPQAGPEVGKPGSIMDDIKDEMEKLSCIPPDEEEYQEDDIHGHMNISQPKVIKCKYEIKSKNEGGECEPCHEGAGEKVMDFSCDCRSPGHICN
ncbi:hypothetical protein KP509_24G021800 [Ceratopteris richardii]|uniref:Uncharacterized protein n=2 Tax=Ceratopteris richardii TaxID=49495 RepID=A0A8T2RT17_CERRI|nr:hypothetical protein KP509_24G021800 [Ceratopteris richardii]